MRRYVVAFLIASAAVMPAHGGTPTSKPEAVQLEGGEGRAVALKLADELVKTFVLPDEAKDYAAMLRKNAEAGRYDSGTRGDLANRLTDDLLAVHKDGHLHVG